MNQPEKSALLFDTPLHGATLHNFFFPLKPLAPYPPPAPHSHHSEPELQNVIATPFRADNVPLNRTAHQGKAMFKPIHEGKDKSGDGAVACIPE